MNRQFCGFLSTIYHVDITSRNKFDRFQAEYSRGSDIIYKTWGVHRKTNRTHMVNPSNYTTSHDSDEFHKFFSLTQFKKPSVEERDKHKYLGCLRSPRLTTLAAKYKLKRCNLKFIVEPESLTDCKITGPCSTDLSAADKLAILPKRRRKRKAQHKTEAMESVLEAHMKEERNLYPKWDRILAEASWAGSLSLEEL